MNENKGITLFDPIINSEDEMIKNAGLQNAKFQAYTYLRAYIMATLCFTQQVVVTDTAIILNRALRTLIDKDEEGGNYFRDESKYLLYPADFSWLIKKGYIRVAFRDKFENFFDLYDNIMLSKKHVDLPLNKKYIKEIDAICPQEFMKKYNINEASKAFSSLFRNQIYTKMNDENILHQREKQLENLIYRLSDKEVFTYNDVKSILIDDIKLDKKDPDYEFIHKILRQSYDYNIPDLLSLDCCTPLRDIKHSQKQDWKLDLSCEKLERDFMCSVYGLATLPVRNLQDIWGSPEFEDFQEKLVCFRKKSIELNEYIESLNKYLLKINDVVRSNYSEKSKKATGLKVEARRYFKTDGKCFIALKVINDIYDKCDFPASIEKTILSKILTSIVRKIDNFPDPPEKMDAAIIIKGETANNHNGPES